ncbi:Poly [ADP-ribose] polymerase [Aphelenchoides besseyi]|nr:Poly [ADP-ribose] polymerase [Aphelenchoides besseyi]
MADETWDKVLYRKHPYPDNYSGRFLSELQTNLNSVEYTFWELIVGACTVICQVDSIIIYFCIFEFVQSRHLDSMLLGISTIVFIGCCEVLYLCMNRPLPNLRDHLLTATTLVFSGYGFTPIIRTLTTSISSDTIWALSILTFIFSLVFHDFGAAVWIVSVPLSVNLCLTASVFLISRVENDLDAFLLLSLSLGCFSFWPRIRNQVFEYSKFIPIILAFTLTTMFSFIHIIVIVCCPILYVRMQKYKNTLNGPWDEARLAASMDARAQKIDPTNPNKSRVVHVRNLNPDVDEGDLIDALSGFGAIAYVVNMPNKGMALVEFEELESARQCVSVSQKSQIPVGESLALFNYSTSPMIQRSGLETDQPNHILIVTVSRLNFPINVRVLHKIYKNYGKIVRIAVLRRNGAQGLIEFENSDVARQAKHETNGADIYEDCNTVKVEYARLESVKVTKNNLDQWDYTLEPDGPDTSIQHSANLEGADENFNIPPTNSGDHQLARAQQKALHDAAREAREYTVHQEDYEQYPSQRHDSWGEARPPKMTRFAGQTAEYDEYERFPERTGPEADRRLQSAVLMIYGVNHQDFDCDRMFNLLCCYGNPLKVKFMHTKQDTCMVEMAQIPEAQNVMRFLQNAKLFGTTLSIRPSKQTTLREITGDAHEMENGTPSFVDFTGHRNQRFSNPATASRNRIVFPTAQLHFFNVPLSFSKEQIMALFTEHDVKGPIPKDLLIFNVKNAHSLSGLATFDDPEQATDALMIYNHAPISDPDGDGPFILKLTYSGEKGREYRAHY